MGAALPSDGDSAGSVAGLPALQQAAYLLVSAQAPPPVLAAAHSLRKCVLVQAWQRCCWLHCGAL